MSLAKAVDAALNEEYKTAFDLWLPLAEEGNAPAQFNVELLYRQGLAVESDIKEAMLYYMPACNQGNHFDLGSFDLSMNQIP